MGCSVGGGFSMLSFGGRRSNGSEAPDLKARFERKMCLARESPEPVFDLSQCGLKAVPVGVYSLCRVFRKETLNVSDNQLIHLHDGGDLTDLFLLRLLDMSGNRFQKLPDTLDRLVNLRELNVSNNRLKCLPDCIGNLTHLRILDASRNCLKSLPPSLGNLLQLRTLNISGNQQLKVLCKELCKAVNLTSISMDIDNYIYPPAEIAQLGIVEIMKFLCKDCGVDYVEPGEDVNDGVSPDYTSPSAISPLEYNKSLRSQLAQWEERDENLQRLENEMHEASKRQKEKFLEEFTKEQRKMDLELNKIQFEKDKERSKLIERIREEEAATGEIFANLMKMSLSNPLHIQQLLEHDEKEHDRLLEMCRSHYTDLRRADTLKAMKSLLQEECEYEKSLEAYGQTQSEVTQSFLVQELNANNKLDELLKTREELQHGLIEKLLQDENMQKAAVGALLEKCDARSWGLVQEISIVEAHLARLSSIELDRRKLELNDNMDNLAEQRIKLSILLVDLLEQQESRRSQLIGTLQAMELEKHTSDFWLIRYQQLLETVPSKFVLTQQHLDPVFANYLLQEGVIHCLPFLVHWLSSQHELAKLDDDMLSQQGIRSSMDRVSILKAVKYYLDEVNASYSKLDVAAPALEYEPSAPFEEEPVDDSEPSQSVVQERVKNIETSECVVCMENNCSVVFIPCGHLCCCHKCSDAIEQSCPMCRQDIERKIRVIQS